MKDIIIYQTISIKFKQDHEQTLSYSYWQHYKCTRRNSIPEWDSPNATKELSCYWAEWKLQREHRKKNCSLPSPLDSTLNLRKISLKGQDNGNYCYTCDLWKFGRSFLVWNNKITTITATRTSSYEHFLAPGKSWALSLMSSGPTDVASE